MKLTLLISTLLFTSLGWSQVFKNIDGVSVANTPVVTAQTCTYDPSQKDVEICEERLNQAKQRLFTEQFVVLKVEPCKIRRANCSSGKTIVSGSIFFTSK